MLRNEKIFVAGDQGMLGSALIRGLRAEGYENLLLASREALDLREQAGTRLFLGDHKPDYVFLAAAKVGGILSNQAYPADYLYDNLMIQANVIEASRRAGVKKLCFIGSSCMYPRDCAQPMKEEFLMGGRLEPTNEGYALAKLAGMKQAQFDATQYGFKTVSPVPCNLYGPNDCYDLDKSHVLSALVRRFVDACEVDAPAVTLWGTGAARREFLHVDDCARALIMLMNEHELPWPVNVGSGVDLSIQELALLVREAAGYEGEILWDPSKPDGMPRKCLDISQLRSYGFSPKITLREGIRGMIEEYRALSRPYRSGSIR